MLLFFQWLIRLPFLLAIGALLAGMIIGTYKILTHYWGDDIFSEILQRKKKEKKLRKKIQENKDWEWRLSHEQLEIEEEEDKINIIKGILSTRQKQLNESIRQKNDLVESWKNINEQNTIPLNNQLGAIRIARERISSRANKDTFYKALKNVSKEFTLVTPNDVEVVRHYLQEQFIDNECETFVMNVFDLLAGRHVNCYVIAWMLYTMLHSDLTD